MSILLALIGCLPYDGLDADRPVVQNERLVDCSVTALSEIRRQGEWQPYFDREQEHDEWGNLVYDRIDLIGGSDFFELNAEYRGEWLDRYEESEDFDGTQRELLEIREWEGIFLTEVTSTENGTTSTTTYSTDGVNPYDRSEGDSDGDGELDFETSFEWEGGQVVSVDVDEERDGTIDQTRAIDYDDEGRIVRDDIQRRDIFQLRTYEWAGPHDNLLDFRDESGEIDGPSTVRRTIQIWDDNWTSSEAEQREAGEVIETNSATYDDEGRLLTYTRDFPGQQVNRTRETWTWSCP